MVQPLRKSDSRKSSGIREKRKSTKRAMTRYQGFYLFSTFFSFSFQWWWWCWINKCPSGGSRLVRILTQARRTGSTPEVIGTAITPRSKTFFNARSSRKKMFDMINIYVNPKGGFREKRELNRANKSWGDWNLSRGEYVWISGSPEAPKNPRDRRKIHAKVIVEEAWI